MCVSVRLGRFVFPWLELCREGGNRECAHPGNVTELAAARRGMSFLVVNKSRMEMRHSITARKRKGGVPRAVTVQCKIIKRRRDA